jgi:hypothetical protein
LTPRPGRVTFAALESETNRKAITMQNPVRSPFACALALSIALAGATAAALAQERFSLYVPTDPAQVERMIKLANIRDGDVVVDLGSGDGRLVLMAAGKNPKVRGWGVDINEELVRKSNEAAAEQGLADRAQFYHKNVFDADLREVSVIKMWLYPELMRMLRPKILKEARPGTRVVTHTWDLGSWAPDATDNEGLAKVFLWIVPARVEGYWNWELPIGELKHKYAAIMEQRFQTAEGVVRSANRRGIFDGVKLQGEELAFTLAMTLDGAGFVHHAFVGKVRGDRIDGTVAVRVNGSEPVDLPWRATRTRNTAYFDPAGVDAK